MAKNKVKPTKENSEMEKSDEVLTVVDNKKKSKADKAEIAKAGSDKKAKQTKKKKTDKQKRNYGKEVMSELKKVNWPTFKKACAQTGTVLAVVAVFMLAVLGIDTLVAWILDLIVKI